MVKIMIDSENSALPKLDLTVPELWRNPGPICAPFFAAGKRVARVPATDGVMLFRHTDVAEALTHPNLGGSGVRAFEAVDWTSGAFADWMRRDIVSLDPPAHSRMRVLFDRAFTPRRVAALGPLVRTVAEALADEMLEAGEIDLYSRFAQRLPLALICNMLGIPNSDHTQMQRWTVAISAATGIPRPQARRAADEAITAVSDYVGEMLNERRKRKADDPIGALIEAEEAGQRLNREEFSALVIQLLVAGHATTSNLIANGLYSLLQHPAEMSRLRADPTLLDNAVEEMLRFEPPLIWTARVTQSAVELGGVPIPADRLVMLNLAGASRDPTIHPSPERFDIGRENIQLLNFGLGTDDRLGTALARLEARTALAVLLERFREISFAGEPPQFAAFTALRTLESFWVRVRGR